MNDLADIAAAALARQHADGHNAHYANGVPDCPECEDAPAEDRPHTFVLASTTGLTECAMPGCGRGLTSRYHTEAAA